MNRSRTTVAALRSGYRLHGEYNEDERIILNTTVKGTVVHSLTLVIDNKSDQSTKVYLDEQFVGSFQEHFVSRLKGGVFVTHKTGNVGLFQNFEIKACNVLNPNVKGIKILQYFIIYKNLRT